MLRVCRFASVFGTAAVVVFGLFQPVLAHVQPRPNIVYFFADDLGWGTIAANGQTLLLTPNLDALARGGLNFTRAYATPVCSPSRSSQQTGFHQGHTWTDRNTPSASKAIRAEDTAIGEVLKAAGYETGYFGKWGYGASEDLAQDPVINNPQSLPIRHGYDEFYGELNHIRAHTYYQPSLWKSDVALGPDTFLVPTPNATSPGTALCDDLYTEAAEAFVRRHARGPRPFFMQLSFQLPHAPLSEITRQPGWFDAYLDPVTGEEKVPGASGWPESSKQYAAMVTRMDSLIGRIIEALRDPNGDGNPADSVLDRTLVMFGSDNGGYSGPAAGLFKPNGGLRGFKGSVFEGGIRVPTLAYWPGVIAPGQTSSYVIDVCDLLPTFAELAGAPKPVGTDGVSFAPQLTGQGIQRPRPFLAFEDHNDSAYLWTVIRDNTKLIKKSDGSFLLYDLSRDAHEQTNLLEQTPAPEYPEYVRVRDELHAIALGEGLEQADAYANTHRTWIGPDGGSVLEAAHWSAPGLPAENWIALLGNATTSNRSAVLSGEARTLAFEVSGNGEAGATQTLLLHPGATLTGRNEIRIGSFGELTLDNATLVSLRWVDVQTNAVLTGAGRVEATLYNSGRVAIVESSGATTPGQRIELVRNGGFEQGTPQADGDYSFATLAEWETAPGVNASLDGAKDNNAHSGTYRGLIHGAPDEVRPLIQNTGHVIGLGDTYELEFWHQGFANWDAGDQIRVRVFYVNRSGSQVDLFSATVAPQRGIWSPAHYELPAVTDATAVGQMLWLEFAPAQFSESSGTEWASIDDVSLTLPGTPVVSASTRLLTVTGDYYETSPEAELSLHLAGLAAGETYAQLDVQGTAILAGRLQVELAPDFTPSIGQTFEIVLAARVEGRFRNADGMIRAGQSHFRIHYETNRVWLETVAVTAHGVPYWWFEEHGLGTGRFDQLELADPDHDGCPTWQEFVAGTDPTDALSVLRLSLAPDVGSARWRLQWSSEPGRIYRVEQSDELNTFIPLSPPLPSGTEHGQPLQWVIDLIPTNPVAVFRLFVERGAL